jgi:hypothetical protein
MSPALAGLSFSAPYLTIEILQVNHLILLTPCLVQAIPQK